MKGIGEMFQKGWALISQDGTFGEIAFRGIGGAILSNIIIQVYFTTALRGIGFCPTGGLFAVGWAPETFSTIFMSPLVSKKLSCS